MFYKNIPGPFFTVPKATVEATEASQHRVMAVRSALLRGLPVDPSVRLPSLTDTLEEARLEWILPPLPDTREEALAVALTLGAEPEQAVYLQEHATEFSVKNLNLHSYKTLLFATHGLMAGEFGSGTQPALAQAKRLMIESQQSIQFSPNLKASLAHPLFWAPYILVGEGR
ncbi:MAG: CHAT domain-containing protein [Candidatus Vecturithrix sp.]|nr:CHAT domain-containing protein [Candidatus Vecturithrix sp.]